jgi:SNF2 family DNA or RNA helicase
MFMLDLGQTLGSTITEFRDNWMRRGGYENRDWLFIQGMEDMLAAKVAPYYLRQQQLSHLPPLIQNDISIPLPDDVRATYKRFESDMFAEMADSPDLIAFSGGHKYGMCRQLASGGYYDLDGNPQKFHSAKAEALKEMILDTEGPILVAYQWWHELHQIRRTLNYDVPAINSSTSLKQSQQIIQDWIAGKIPVLLCHPQAMSHGVNGLQKRGNVLIWYSLTNSPDDYDQLNARLHRTGQENTTFIHHLLAKGTIDRRVLRVLREKASLQEAFMDVLTANREPRANQSPVAAFGPNQQQIPWTGVI